MSAAILAGFAAIQHESPRQGALPVLVAVVVLAAIYAVLTSRALVARFPILAHIPGAEKEESMGDDYSKKIETHHQTGDNFLADQIHIGPQSRSLSGVDTTQLRAAATRFPGTEVAVKAPAGDGEAYAFAYELLQLLSECDWNVSGVDQLLGMSGPPSTGVEICVTAATQAEVPWAEALGQALIDSGFATRAWLNQDRNVIRVGRAV